MLDFIIKWASWKFLPVHTSTPSLKPVIIIKIYILANFIDEKMNTDSLILTDLKFLPLFHMKYIFKGNFLMKNKK